MKRKRFTEEQITGILREHETGTKTADLTRKNGLSEATLYNWLAKFGDMDVSDARKLRAWEDENGKLKRLLADASSATSGEFNMPQDWILMLYRLLRLHASQSA